MHFRRILPYVIAFALTTAFGISFLKPTRAVGSSVNAGSAVPAQAHHPIASPPRVKNLAASAPFFVPTGFVQGWGTFNVLYIDDFQLNAVFVYAIGPTPRLVGTIRGLDGPEQMAVDRSGDLYIANTFANQVIVFRPGDAKPFKILKDKLLSPSGVALDSKGTLYVTNNSNYSTVVEFIRGQTTATLLTTAIPDPVSAAVDRYDNLFIGAEVQGVYEKPVGSPTFSQLSLSTLAGQFVIGVGVGPDGVLNVGSEPDTYPYTALPFIARYYPFFTTPYNELVDGYNVPYYFSFSQDSIFVAYVFNNQNPNAPGFVAAYHPGSTVPYLTITAGLSQPTDAVLWTP
jgi:hypothetical protein